MFKAAIKRRIANYLLNNERRKAKRSKAERRRKKENAPHVVEYFHDASDPYSHLLVQLLPEFVRRYEVELKIHIVPSAPDWAAPERLQLETFARKDAEKLAHRAGLSFIDPNKQPTDAEIAKANGLFIAAIEQDNFVQDAYEISQTLWMGKYSNDAKRTVSTPGSVLSSGAARRDHLGHYLGGMLYYAGEWYWGVDRLHYLETRLAELGAKIADGPSGVVFSPPEILTKDVQPVSGKRPELHWYLSFRSPYTAIVVDRVKALADNYGADLKLRYVLPMVMRGMKVPRMKRFYIANDAARESERLGIPFGDICDPLGKPVERGYAILHRAIELGRGFEFTQSFLSGVWAEGIDAGSDKGLKIITERAGLSWEALKPQIDQDHWRAEAELNQAEMHRYGLWGVPSFRVGEAATWGQDRLWVVEEALANHL